MQASRATELSIDGLNTVKLLTLYSVRDRQPVAFAKQPGNVPDVISVQNAIRQLQCFSIDKPIVVTDNGFYSQSNMAEFCWNNMKFMSLASTGNNWVREIVDELRENLDSVSSICSFDITVHCATKMIMKEFTHVRQRARGSAAAGDAEPFSRRLYVHVCYSRGNAFKDEERLVRDLFELKQLIEEGAEEALRTYGLREQIEELFNVQKNSLDGRRPRVWFPDSLQGRFFVQFVALGYRCWLTKKIGEIKEWLGTEKDGKTKEELELEKSLQKWLDARSLIQILEWFDCMKPTSVTTPLGMERWSTESVRRDQLFLKLLGL